MATKPGTKSLNILKDSDIRLLSPSGFDVPKPVRAFFLIVALTGIALIFVESLTPSRPERIELDKIIHFTGYGALALTLSLALRFPTLLISLPLVGLGGVAIEFLQKLTGRSYDTNDMLANALGLVAGFALGITARWLWQMISKEMAGAFAGKKLRIYRSGALIVREGEPIRHLMIIKSGRVQVSRSEWKRSFDYGEGGIIGMMAAIKGEKQFTTVTALEKTILYKIPIVKLHKNAARTEAPVAMVLDGMADALTQMAGKIQEAEQGVRPENNLPRKQ